jgi:hypothetical protein
MAKKYEPPEMYSENIETTFIGAQCTPTSPGAGMNDVFPGWCDGCEYYGLDG